MKICMSLKLCESQYPSMREEKQCLEEYMLTSFMKKINDYFKIYGMPINVFRFRGSYKILVFSLAFI